MAIAQTATATQIRTTANPQTMAFDCNGGNLLVLSIYALNSHVGIGTPTYNSVSMTDSGQGAVDSTGESTISMWFLPSPAAGSNTISIPNVNGRVMKMHASAWSGVDVADALDTSNSGLNSGSADPSVAVTTTQVGELIVDTMADSFGSVPSANSHTLMMSNDEGAWSTNTQYTLDDGTSGITLSWTVASDSWAMIVCAFNPAGGAPAGDIESVAGVSWANIESVAGVAKASIQSVAGVDGQ